MAFAICFHASLQFQISLIRIRFGRTFVTDKFAAIDSLGLELMLGCIEEHQDGRRNSSIAGLPGSIWDHKNTTSSWADTFPIRTYTHHRK